MPFEPIVQQRQVNVSENEIRRLIEAKFGVNINFTENRLKTRRNSDLRKVYILVCYRLGMDIGLAIKCIGMAEKSAYLSLRTANLLKHEPFIAKTFSEIISELDAEKTFHV